LQVTHISFLRTQHLPTSTLFPYTTLFRSLAESLGDGHTILTESLEKLETVKSLEELRGIEGNASRAYFDLFRRWNRSELPFDGRDRKSTRLNSSHVSISYAVFCLKKKMS